MYVVFIKSELSPFIKLFESEEISCKERLKNIKSNMNDKGTVRAYMLPLWVLCHHQNAFWHNTPSKKRQRRSWSRKYYQLSCYITIYPKALSLLINHVLDVVTLNCDEKHTQESNPGNDGLMTFKLFRSMVNFMWSKEILPTVQNLSFVIETITMRQIFCPAGFLRYINGRVEGKIWELHATKKISKFYWHLYLFLLPVCFCFCLFYAI